MTRTPGEVFTEIGHAGQRAPPETLSAKKWSKTVRPLAFFELPVKHGAL